MLWMMDSVIECNVAIISTSSVEVPRQILHCLHKTLRETCHSLMMGVGDPGNDRLERL